MAAPMVNPRAQTVRGKKGNKSYFPVKNTITSPFLAEWPQISNGDSTLALQKIKSALIPHADSLAKQSSKGRRKVCPLPKEAVEKRTVLRSQLALGVNEVTRSLEGGKLDLALVCRSAKPALMTNHLMSLSATRNTPTLCLHGLSDTLAPILKFNCILAIGFKKTSDGPGTFDELIKTIVAMTPPIHVPWLQYKELTQDQLRRVVTNAVLAVKTIGKSKSAGKQKGKNKGQRSSGVQTPDSLKAETAASRNSDSGANVELHSLRGNVAPEHVCLDAANPSKSDSSDQLLQSSEIKLERQAVSTSNTATAKPMQSNQLSPTSKKRKLMETNEPRGPKKKLKTVLKPDYKPVSVLPVKIIPKAMKDKKQLKKKRKQNKQKK